MKTHNENTHRDDPAGSSMDIGLSYLCRTSPNVATVRVTWFNGNARNTTDTDKDPSANPDWTIAATFGAVTIKLLDVNGGLIASCHLPNPAQVPSGRQFTDANNRTTGYWALWNDAQNTIVIVDRDITNSILFA